MRKTMRKSRNALKQAGTHADKSAAACQHILGYIKEHPCKIVASYLAIGGELNVSALHEAKPHVKLCLPFILENRRGLAFRSYGANTLIEPGPMNTFQPSEIEQIVVPDTILVPLLAFDRNGMRLGQGGGYYDSTIVSMRRNKQVSRVIGVGFACQEVDEVPYKPHDAALDAIATEDGIIYR
ncbi:MAG: 5-formyltetrahydrofolate cyclo-ligase [Pseudomonadota bacterium]